MHHQMAFDSTGLARKAQNRVCKAPWSRVNAEKKYERILDVKQIKDMQGKKNARKLDNKSQTENAAKREI